MLRTITHVCRSWRAITIDSSALWAVIYVPLFSNVERSIQCAQMYLNRSGDQPLQIIINLGDCNSGDITIKVENACVERVMREILPHMPRWQSFSIRTMYVQSAVAALCYLDGRADVLEVLTAGCTVYNLFTLDPLMRVSLLAPTFVAPRLRRLELLHVDDTRPPAASLEEQFPNLDQLRLVIMFPTQFPFKSMCTHSFLRVLHLKASPYAAWELDVAINLPNLHELSFDQVNPSTIGRFLTHCTAPLLNHVEVSSMDIHPSHPALPRIDWNPQSLRFPLFRSLKFRHTTLLIHGAHSLMVVLNTELDFCRSLHIEMPGEIIWFLRALSVAREGRWACPNLERLTIDLSTKGEEALLRNLVGVRRKASERGLDVADGQQNVPIALTEVHLRTGCEIPIEVWEAWADAMHLKLFTWTRVI